MICIESVVSTSKSTVSTMADFGITRLRSNSDFQREVTSHRSYVVFAESSYEEMAQRLCRSQPERFRYFPIKWEKFPDGTDNIQIEGYNSPDNCIASSHVLFFASFHNNDVTLSQFSVFIVLLQSFIESMTILLPFYPVGTMDRVDVEGKVATANTYSMLLSSLPSTGKPTRLMIYDVCEYVRVMLYV